MDAVEDTNEFQDWEEILHPNSESDSLPTDSVNTFEDIDPDGGTIQANYFSLDSRSRLAAASLYDFDDKHSAESDNPSWIEPESEKNPNRYVNKESAEFWSDSCSDKSDDKFGDFLGKNEVGHLKFEEKHGFSEGIEEMIERNGKDMDHLDKLYADSSQTKADSGKVDVFEENSQVGIEGSLNSHDGLRDSVEDKSGNLKNSEIKKREFVWWKMPIELLRYCVFRVSPVWTVSVAAAVMGFMILGRRLYRMKKKAMGLEIKVTMDDKKVSQFMSRAARLNEAFSVVKRVPVIRPSLPALGVQTWPAMSLRSM